MARCRRMNAGIIEARINLGWELIQAEKFHHATEADWVIYLGGRNISKDQAQTLMRIARRFHNSDMLPLLLALEPSAKILLALCGANFTEDMTKAFFAKVKKYTSDMQCEIVIAEIMKGNSHLLAPALNKFDKAQEDKVTTQKPDIDSVAPKDAKVSIYLTNVQADKLDDLAYRYKNKTNKRINRNDIVRKLIERCSIDDLQGIV